MKLLGVSKRISQSLGANAYAQLTALSIQLSTVPIVLTFWGWQQFGVWTYCVAISVYFGLIDFGFMAAGLNKVCILAFGGFEDEAQKIISSLWVYFFSIIFLVNIPVGIFLFVLDVNIGLDEKSKCALFFLIANAVVATSSSIFDSIFRANDSYSKGTILLETIRLSEWISMIGVISAGGGIVSAAVAMFLVRFICVVMLFLHIENNSLGKYKNIIKNGKLFIVFGLKKEALSWSAIRYGESMALQGPIILTATLINPTAAALLSAYRTISRAALQFSALIAHSLWQEFAQAMAMKSEKMAKKLLIKSTIITFLGSLIIALIIFMNIEVFLEFWGRGKIPIDKKLLGLFLVSIIATATWYPSRIFLMASASLNNIGFIYLIFNLIGVFILFNTLERLGGNVVPIVALLIEVLIGLIVFKMIKKVVGKNV